MTNYPSLPKTALAVSVALIISGCGGGGGGGGGTTPPPGGGTATLATIRLSGAVVDGYVTDATVCLDLNLNGRCDTSEPSVTTSATTDNPGRFTLELLPTNVNYTGWITHPNFKTAPLVVEGGTDIDTDLPFESRMSTPLPDNVRNLDPNNNTTDLNGTTNLTAVTTLLQNRISQAGVNANRDTLKTTIQNQLGLTATDGDLEADPIALLNANRSNNRLLATNVAVNRAIQSMLSTVGAADADERRQLSENVYRALARANTTSGTSGVDQLLEAITTSEDAKKELAGGGEATNRLTNAARLAAVTARQTATIYEKLSTTGDVTESIRQAATRSTNVVRMVEAAVASGRVNLENDNVDISAAESAAKSATQDNFSPVVGYLEVRLPTTDPLTDDQKTALQQLPEYTGILSLRDVHNFINSNLSADATHKQNQQAVLTTITKVLIDEINPFLTNLGFKTTGADFTGIETIQWTDASAANYLPRGFTVDQAIALTGFPAELKRGIANTRIATALLRDSNIELTATERTTLRELDYFYAPDTGTLTSAFTLTQLSSVAGLPESLKTKVDTAIAQRQRLTELETMGIKLTDIEKDLMLTQNGDPASVTTKLTRTTRAITLLKKVKPDLTTDEEKGIRGNESIYAMPETFDLRNLRDTPSIPQNLRDAIVAGVPYSTTFVTETFASSLQCPAGGYTLKSGFGEGAAFTEYKSVEICNGSSISGETSITPLSDSAYCGASGGFQINLGNDFTSIICNSGTPNYNEAKALVTDLGSWMTNFETYAETAATSLQQQADGLATLMDADAIAYAMDALAITLDSSFSLFEYHESGATTGEAGAGVEVNWKGYTDDIYGELKEISGNLVFNTTSRTHTLLTDGTPGAYFLYSPYSQEQLTGGLVEVTDETQTVAHLVKVDGSIIHPANSGTQFDLTLSGITVNSYPISKADYQGYKADNPLTVASILAGERGRITLPSGTAKVTTSKTVDNLGAFDDTTQLGDITLNLALGSEASLVTIRTLNSPAETNGEVVFTGYLGGVLQSKELTVASLPGWHDQELASLSNAHFNGKLSYNSQELVVDLGLEIPQTRRVLLENFTLADNTGPLDVELNTNPAFQKVVSITASDYSTEFNENSVNLSDWGYCNEANLYIVNNNADTTKNYMLARYGEMVDAEGGVTAACNDDNNAESLYIFYLQDGDWHPIAYSNSATELLSSITNIISHQFGLHHYTQVQTANPADGTAEVYAQLDLSGLYSMADGVPQSFSMKVQDLWFDTPTSAENFNRYNASAQVDLTGVAGQNLTMRIDAERTGYSQRAGGGLKFTLDFGGRTLVANYQHPDFTRSDVVQGDPLQFTFSDNNGTLLTMDNNIGFNCDDGHYGPNYTTACLLGTNNMGIFHNGMEHGRLYMDGWGDWIAVFGDGTEQRIYTNLNAQ